MMDEQQWYDLFEDVAAKLRYEKLTRQQQHAELARIVYTERTRWIEACNTVSDGAERARRHGVQTVAQVRKLAIDGPNV
jgi:hypothetical protein